MIDFSDAMPRWEGGERMEARASYHGPRRAVKPEARLSAASAGEHLLQDEVDLALLLVHPGHLDPDPVAEAEATPPAVPDQGVLLLPELVVVVVQSVHVHQPLDEKVVQEHEEAERHHP